jgi:hypothetical protein
MKNKIGNTIILVIALAVGAEAIAQEDHPFLAPGNDRDAYVTASLKNCKEKAGSISSFVYGKAGISNFCSCITDKSADAMTSGELLYELQHHESSASFTAQLKEIFSACTPKSNLK